MEFTFTNSLSIILENLRFVDHVLDELDFSRTSRSLNQTSLSLPSDSLLQPINDVYSAQLPSQTNHSTLIDSQTVQKEINTPVLPTLKEPSSRLFPSPNTSMMNHSLSNPPEEHSIVNMNDETFEELEEPESMLDQKQHKRLDELSVIEEKSMIQQDSYMEQTMLDDSLVEAEPLYLEYSQIQNGNPTLVELDRTEQYVTLRNQLEAISDDDFNYVV